jgi:APA family basic amino acid/polyamine antiporter
VADLITQIGFVAGEMENPAKNLPRIIRSSMTIVMIGFVLMNVALYLTLSIEQIRESEAVAVVSLKV